MKKFIINFVQYTVFIGLGILLLYLSFRGKNFNEIKHYILTANYYWVLLMLIFGFIALLMRVYRWNLLIEPAGYNPKTSNTYHAMIIGYTANYALPRIGEVVRCGTLSKTEKIPVDVLLGTVIVERVFDLICLIILTFLTLVLKLKFFGDYFKVTILDNLSKKISASLNFSSLVWIFILVSLVGILLLGFTFRQRILKIAMVKKLSNLAKGLITGMKTVIKLKRKREFVLYTIAMWFLYFLMSYVLFFALPSTSKLTMVDGLFIFVLGSYGMAAPVQGGMGAYHSLVSAGLIGLYLIPNEEAVAYTVLSHETQLIFIVLAGTISLFILFLRRRKTSKNLQNVKAENE